MASSWVAVAFTTDLPVGVTNVLLTALMFVAIVAAVLAAFRVLDLVAGYFARRAKRSEHRFDDLVVPLAATTAKLAAVLIGVVAAVATQNDELPATLIGGLGIGGVAIALASQETLSNFIGSIMLLFDRPFEVGDWVRIDDLEGEVESLGFRSTKLRTGLNSQVTVPNSKLAAANVDNLGRRKYRRYLNKLGLEYGTSPDQIEAFCEGVRELIRRHPHTRKDFYAAYFNDFGPSSLDVLVVVYFQVPDWATELRERHRCWRISRGWRTRCGFRLRSRRRRSTCTGARRPRPRRPGKTTRLCSARARRPRSPASCRTTKTVPGR